MGESYKVAVIGAGVAGFVTARELQRESHHVTVLEKANKIGGIRLYNPLVETHPLGLDPNREIVHSSLYKSLRVISPRHAMSFMDHPFLKKEGDAPRPFPGTDTWPGLQMHSHNYRTLEQFKNKIAVLIGKGPSGIEILKEISPLQKKFIKLYKYHYPFIKPNGIVTVNDNRVEEPLYKHVFPPKLAPWLSFVGLTYRAVVFRVMELQAKRVAKVFSGTVELPPQEAMACSVEQFYSEMEKTGWPSIIHSLQNDEVEFSRIPREANVVVDLLAKTTFDTTTVLQTIDLLPPAIQDVVLRDLHGPRTGVKL
ncbi:Detected protein of unknown function [Hibiscus syriacus]|uniref:Flavin-containing monooxygenase n=1 Tax=Hibiscus syriacus TaxID=106335 RepID=A0A6A3D5G9_HIBSY|nr:Detected protein of unknown function [Hibiscus syriacus]